MSSTPINLPFDTGSGPTIVNPSEPLAPTTGVYGGLFQPLFGTLSTEKPTRGLGRFLQTNKSANPPPTIAQTQSLFNQYASIYALLENAIASSQNNFTLNLPLLNPPTTGFFGTAFQSYFASETPVQQQQIWVQFLLNNNYTTTPPPDTPENEALFINFAATILEIIQSTEIQSPDEIKKRYIMTLTLNTLMEMLDSLQDTVGVESENLVFYGTWQQDYTSMMAGVPTYVGQPDDAVQVPSVVNSSTNFDDFTFGYDKISVTNISDWWATNSLNGKNQPFVMTSQGTDGAGAPLMTITYTPQSGSTAGSITWAGPPGSTGISGSTTIPLQPAVSTFTPNSAQSSSIIAENAYATAFTTAFAAAWNGGLQTSLAAINSANLLDINAVNPTTGRSTSAVQPRSTPDTSANSAMELPWGYSYIVPSSEHSDASGNITTAGSLSDSNAMSRGEVNANLQNVIENIRSRREVVQNLASALQTNLDQANQTITDQSDLLDSILQTITDLVQAIYNPH